VRPVPPQKTPEYSPRAEREADPVAAASGKRVLAIFAALLVVAVGGGGAWYWKAQQAASPAATAARPDAPHVAAAPAADSAHKDTTVVAAAADSAPPRPAAVQPPANLDALLAPVHDALDEGRQRTNNGDYEVASLKLGDAQEKIGALARKYPDLPAIKSLRRDVSDAIASNRTACRAERDDALKRGATAPDCQ
jgi:hypothetical protein